MLFQELILQTATSCRGVYVCTILIIFTTGYVTGDASFCPASPAGYSLKYKSRKGEIFTYESVQRHTRSLERGGQSFEVTENRTFRFQLEAEPGDSLLSFILTIQHLESATEGGRSHRREPPNFDEAIGKRLRVKMKPDGEETELTAIDRIPMPERRPRRNFGMGGRQDSFAVFRTNFFRLPERSLTVGDSWIDTVRDSSRSDDPERSFSRSEIEERQTKYTVLAEEIKMGLACFHIKLESTYSRQSQGTTPNGAMQSEAEGETTSEVWFAHENGILVEYHTDDFSEGTTAFTGQTNRTSPFAHESKTSLKLLELIPTTEKRD